MKKAAEADSHITYRQVCKKVQIKVQKVCCDYRGERHPSSLHGVLRTALLTALSTLRANSAVSFSTPALEPVVAGLKVTLTVILKVSPTSPGEGVVGGGARISVSACVLPSLAAMSWLLLPRARLFIIRE